MEKKVMDNLTNSAILVGNDLFMSCIKNRYLISSINQCGRQYVLIDTTKEMPRTFSKLQEHTIKSYEVIAELAPINNYLH